MNARTVAQIFAVAGVVGTLVAGCVAPVDGSEQTGTSDEAMIKTPGGSSGAGGSGPLGLPATSCGTATALTGGGTVTIGKVPTPAQLEANFESALKELGCGPKQAYAVGTGGAGTAWFQSVCPQNVISADKFYCPTDSSPGNAVYVQMSLGVLYLCYYNESIYGMTFGNTTAWCGSSVPSGEITADWDPNCSGSSCAKQSGI